MILLLIKVEIQPTVPSLDHLTRPMVLASVKFDMPRVSYILEEEDIFFDESNYWKN